MQGGGSLGLPGRVASRTWALPWEGGLIAVEQSSRTNLRIPRLKHKSLHSCIRRAPQWLIIKSRALPCSQTRPVLAGHVRTSRSPGLVPAIIGYQTADPRAILAMRLFASWHDPPRGWLFKQNVVPWGMPGQLRRHGSREKGSH